MGGHGLSRVLGHKIGVDVRPGHRAGIGGGEYLRGGVGYVPGYPHPGHGGEARSVGLDVLAHAGGVGGRLQPEAGQYPGASGEARPDNHGAARDDLAVLQPDAREPVFVDFERSDLTFHDRDAERRELLGLFTGGLGRGVQEKRQVRRQLPKQ